MVWYRVAWYGIACYGMVSHTMPYGMASVWLSASRAPAIAAAPRASAGRELCQFFHIPLKTHYEIANSVGLSPYPKNFIFQFKQTVNECSLLVSVSLFRCRLMVWYRIVWYGIAYYAIRHGIGMVYDALRRRRASAPGVGYVSFFIYR